MNLNICMTIISNMNEYMIIIYYYILNIMEQQSFLWIHICQCYPNVDQYITPESKCVDDYHCIKFSTPFATLILNIYTDGYHSLNCHSYFSDNIGNINESNGDLMDYEYFHTLKNILDDHFVNKYDY